MYGLYDFRYFVSVALLIMFFDKAHAQEKPAPYPIDAPINFVRTWTATAPEQDANRLVKRPSKDVNQSTLYIDGLGRPLQTVIKGGSLETGNSPKDMVAPIEYDAFGRQLHQWIPYASTESTGSFKTDPFEQQRIFMVSEYGLQGETYFYGQTDYDPSPINRPFKRFSPGNSWVGSGRGTAQNFWINTQNDSVVIWNVTDNATAGQFGSYVYAGMYTAGQLIKNVITDENGKQTIEYRDKENNVVLVKLQLKAMLDDGNGSGHSGWVCTYFLYDDLGRQRCVIQPNGVDQLLGNGWDLTDTLILNEQCFRYEYDQRNRNIIKRMPGDEPVYRVYDAYDHIVMEQDGNMRTLGNWKVTVYDNMDRPLKTGMLVDATDFGTHLSNAYGSPNYPGNVGNLLTQTHYDDYEGLPKGLSGTYSNIWDKNLIVPDNNVWPYPQPVSQNSGISTKGLETWVQSTLLGKYGYLSTVNIYDDDGRLIQSQGVNITNGSDVSTTQFSWTGKPLVEIEKLEKADGTSQSIITVSKIDYDELGRHIQTQEKLSYNLVNSNSMTGFNTVSSLKYDAFGRLLQKELGRQKGIDGNYSDQILEKQFYEYNIRGWLLGMNRSFVQDLSSTNSSHGSGEHFTTPTMAVPSNFFGFDLGYDKNGILDTYNHRYDGNIAGTIWKSAHDGQVRKYDFSYDAIKRLSNADFNQYSDDGFGKTAKVDFSALNMDYDANGNMEGMKQMGLVNKQPVPIDRLRYSYFAGSNRLQQVTDTANNIASNLGDFSYDPINKTTIDYTYDANGNMISDANKKISSIAYNYLNLPELVVVDGKGKVAFVYDGFGNKLQKTITEGNKITTITYINGAVYQNDTLQFIAMEEGRIRPNSVSNVFIFDYFLKDQLGNTRMTITDDPTAESPILDATSYYPFGLKMAGISYDSRNVFENNNKFNGKELQHHEFRDSSGLELYDYGARMLDPQLGRMWQQDPMAGNYHRMTPYNYVANNPVNGIDPDGKDVIFLNASSGANGAGHASVMIGNATDGWFYYSLNGTETQSVYGDSYKPDIGTAMGHGKNIRKLITNANTVNPSQLHNYDRFVIIKTTTEEDENMKMKAAEAASVEKYIVIGQSCLDVAKAAYNTLVDSRIGYVHDFVDQGTRKDPIPNAWFINLPDTFNSMNSIINFLGVGSSNNFVSPPKQKPVIIVGPTLHQEN